MAGLKLLPYNWRKSEKGFTSPLSLEKISYKQDSNLFHMGDSQKGWSRGGPLIHMLRSQLQNISAMILYIIIQCQVTEGCIVWIIQSNVLWCWFCVCLTHEILHFQFAEALHDLQNRQRPPFHSQMQRHGHKQTTEIDSQVTDLYLIDAAWQKSKYNSEKSSNKNFSECCNISSPNSMDLASPLNRVCDDVHN